MSRSELQAIRQFCSDWIIAAFHWKYIIRLNPNTREVQVNPGWWGLSYGHERERLCEICMIYCAADDDLDALVEGGPLLVFDAKSEKLLKEYPAENLDFVIKRLDQYRESDRPSRTTPRNRPILRLSHDRIREKLSMKPDIFGLCDGDQSSKKMPSGD